MPPLSSALLPFSRPWRGALIAEEGGERTAFSLHSSHSPGGATSATSPATETPASATTGSTAGATIPLFGLTITMADAAPQPVQLLDGAQRALVGLVENAQLLFDARVTDGRLVGRWWRRNDSGEVVAQGALDASQDGAAGDSAGEPR